ncbi:hypothetical protein IGI04_026236 [Brassica rapa subsp. trilocularis]|uniref:SWIM-type domain-containing protein n=1 Tax=Brassica rapa subsp. trilocularis TaxID=1813537 RepID=A0ABQ7KVP0_BRACM|nr:hypothetical protein IGI04_026236 [Brassica rapa subsp. trilocularis]
MWKKLHRLHPFCAIKGGYQQLNSAKQNSPNNPVLMGRLFRLIMGLWCKSSTGVWNFKETPNSEGEALIINMTDSVDGIVERIRITLNLGILTPVVLTYQLPPWMLHPDGPTTPPITLVSNKDVKIMTSVTDYIEDAVLYVTSGPEHVAKYQFLCRTPFTIDEKTYLEDGVTEKEHRQAILDLVGGHPIVCSKHMLEIMFNEPQLLLVFRVALEIEMVYGLENDDDHNAEPPDNLTINESDFLCFEGAVPLSPNPLDNYNTQDEVLYGEPITIEDLQNSVPNFEATPMVHQGDTFDQEPLHVWENMAEDETYWDGMMEGERAFEVYIARSPLPTEEVIGLSLAHNRRVCAPQPETFIVIDDDDDNSYTGSTNGNNELDNIIALPPPVQIEPDSTEDNINSVTVLTRGEPSAAEKIIHTVDAPNNLHATSPTATGATTEPFLDLTLGVGIGNNRADPEPLSDGRDASSESEDGCGIETNNADSLYEGKVFKSRADFKQQIALYALRNKFRFRNARSTPAGMVLRCVSSSCKWRIYAVKMKNVEKYEIRRVISEHTCSVDERAGINHINNISCSNFPSNNKRGGMLVRRINDVGFEVKDKDGCSYHVNLATKSCSCYSFQKLLIPFSHAIASAIKEKVSIESLVSDFYTVENLSLVYGEDILPISNESNTSGPSTEVVGEAIEIFPPSSRRPPGRPRKSRILSTGEIRPVQRVGTQQSNLQSCNINATGNMRSWRFSDDEGV